MSDKTTIIKDEIISTVQSFNETGLSVGTSGNASVRIGDTFLITPTGIPYQEMETGDIVEMDMDGTVLNKDRKPSSEWRFHRDIYRNRDDVNAVVHVHSSYATAIACTRQSIPAFHYMVAIAGGNTIECADYATFGTEELSRNAVAALGNRLACLLANHGMISVGPDLDSAFSMAGNIEELARQYYLSCQLGEPVLLDEEEMRTNLEKFAGYGKQDP